VFLDDRFDELQGLEDRITEIAVAVGAALVGVGVGVGAVCGDFLGSVLAAVVFINELGIFETQSIGALEHD
jgi:hypothetical protein